MINGIFRWRTINKPKINCEDSIGLQRRRIAFSRVRAFFKWNCQRLRSKLNIHELYRCLISVSSKYMPPYESFLEPCETEWTCALVGSRVWPLYSPPHNEISEYIPLESLIVCFYLSAILRERLDVIFISKTPCVTSNQPVCSRSFFQFAFIRTN